MTTLDEIQQAAEGAKCPSCGLPRPDAKHIIDLPDMLLPRGHCGALLHPAWADECANRETDGLRSRIATLESALSAATARASELESIVDAWRKLAEWSGRADRTVSVGYFVLEATQGGKQAGIVRFGQFPSQAAIDLATKLGLIAPDGKEE